MGDRYESIHETVSMENCKCAAAPSVKSEQKPVFGGLGTGLNMTKAGWLGKYLSFLAVLEHSTSMKKNAQLFLSRLQLN